MKKFLKNLLSFLIIPFLFVMLTLVLYIRADVYADFGEHKNYSWRYYWQQLGDVSTKKLLHTGIRYNSFIFGSSRSTNVYACYLQQQIPDALFFHYANWNETIGGMYAKLHLIDSLGYDINNVLMYFDTDYTFEGDAKVSPHDHYLLTGQTKFDYYRKHYRRFYSSFEPDKLKVLLGMDIQGDLFPNWQSDLYTNDGNHTCSDSIINGYGQNNQDQQSLATIDSLISCGFLYKRSPVQHAKDPQISMDEKEMLLGIKAIFTKHRTSYNIVITPLYDQLTFAPSDLRVLRDIFGSAHILDCSGINEMTNNPYNYPDRKHFLPYISKSHIDSLIHGDRWINP